MCIQSEWGETALFVACRCGHADIARVLLDHGASVHHRNKVSVYNMPTHATS